MTRSFIPAQYQDDAHIWLTRKEAAACMGMSYDTFRVRRKQGKLGDLDYNPENDKFSRASVINHIEAVLERAREEAAA